MASATSPNVESISGLTDLFSLGLFYDSVLKFNEKYLHKFNIGNDCPILDRFKMTMIVRQVLARFNRFLHYFI